VVYFASGGLIGLRERYDVTGQQLFCQIAGCKHLVLVRDTLSCDAFLS
jgi:hypothetical protein